MSGYRAKWKNYKVRFKFNKNSSLWIVSRLENKVDLLWVFALGVYRVILSTNATRNSSSKCRIQLV